MRPWSEVVAELHQAHANRKGPRWHLVQVAAHAHDEQAVRRLRRHYEAYYPKERSWRPVPRQNLSRRQRAAPGTRLEEKVRPLFPRYAFCRFDPAGPWHEIFRLSGITGVVLRQGLPMPIGDDLIASLRAHEINGAIPGTTPAIQVFRIGQRIQVTSGPFSALRGAIERIHNETLDGIDAVTKFTILIEILGRFTPVEVTADAVQRL